MMLVSTRSENRALREKLSSGQLYGRKEAVEFSTIQHRTSRRLDEVHSRMPEILHQSAFNTLMDLGSAFMYAGRFDEAMNIYEQAKQVKPDNEEPYKAQAAIYKLKGAYDDSIGVLKVLLENQPGNAGAWNYLGWNYFNIGKLDDARRSYERALRIQPEFPDARFNLALVEKAQGFNDRYMQLLEEARRALAREIEKKSRHATAYFHLAKTYAYEKNWAEAMKYLNRAITEDSEWAFWLRHEVFFQDMPDSYAPEQQVITTLADAYIEFKINRILDSLT
jgi:tetratricopeptide (TPR) repeat protein